MKVLLLCKAPLEELPPVVTLATVLARCGYDTHVVTSQCNDAIRNSLEEAGVSVVPVCQKELQKGPKLVATIRRWRSFAKACWRYIDQQGEGSLIWVAAADTALALGRRLLAQRFVLEVLELYDRFPLYRVGLRPYMEHAALVVVPEESRAGIFRVWYRLSETPQVLPNKPLGVSSSHGIPDLSGEVKAQLASVQGRRLLVYQAAFVRMDLTNIARAVNDLLGDEYVLGVLGNIRDREMFSRVKATTARLVHFGYVQHPSHLLLTRQAFAGIMIYDYESLNNLFCAPNKTWEYASCGIPMVCNRLPALQKQLEMYQAGEAFEFGSPQEFAGAVERIAADYDTYSAGAKRLYDSVDLHSLVPRIVEAALRNSDRTRRKARAF